MSETPSSPEVRSGKLTPHQELALRGLCDRYEVAYSEDDYFVYPEDSFMMPGYAEGWIGGSTHANPDYARPQEPAEKPTLFVGVAPDGRVSS